LQNYYGIIIISPSKTIFIDYDNVSFILLLFIKVNEKNFLQKIKKNQEIYFNSCSEIFSYLTFLSLFVLKNIILKLKNNIEMIRAGTIYSIKSELNIEGRPEKIKCM